MSSIDKPIPALTHSFVVLLGKFSLGFTRVSGLSNDFGYEYFREGGQMTPHPIKSAHNQLQTLVFEHGFGTLPGFEQEIRNLQTPQAGTIIISGFRQMIGFVCRMPIRWELGDLNANQSGILIRRMEIIHDGLYYVD